MQDRPLLVSSLLDHAEREHSAARIVSRRSDGEIVCSTFGTLGQSARRLAGALLSLGVGPGDRVATLAWNTDRHMALYYAVSGIGAIWFSTSN